ncbi:cysteine--tRNA ligase [Bifidobacterium aquikefiri]|uniref:Cysteine--tRNA ligase n=2 Tax=Bifidobacterium aquikefiri TaxID=1653207 RepID=A0A261G4X4_9BIFI|nr:cysteine--tRNA ligase [Bifidobacterium aquikefiri]
MSANDNTLVCMTDSHKPHDSSVSQVPRLRLYDTATHQITPFTPIHPGVVGIYVCGATVQSSPHIGHIRAAVAFDVIRRWFMRLGYTVLFIRNVTDIDDKILDKSRAAGQQWWERAYIYEREFTHAYERLGVLAPSYEPRATGHITDMIDLIQRILDNGHAYVVPDADGKPSGNVYFDVPSWPQYGELTHQQAGTQAADDSAAVADKMGPSVDQHGDDKYNPVDAADLSEDKHDPRDFALWKSPKATDPQTARWKTPFGIGRPGWHLECSAMSHRYLGADFDIHGGGLDLRFPHHENEMAQSKAAGWGFAHHWMHSAWVTAKGEKMSKSLGNGLSVDSILAEHSAWVVRYAMASVQYRSMLEWGDQTLSEAERAHERIMNFIDRADALIHTPISTDDVAALPVTELPAEFVSSMNEDFNVSGATASIFTTIRQGNALLDGARTPNVNSQLRALVIQLRAMLDVLGLDPLHAQWLGSDTPGDASSQEHLALDALIGEQLAKRAEARKNKDFAQADTIRDELGKAGIVIEDTPSGSSWSME